MKMITPKQRLFTFKSIIFFTAVLFVTICFSCGQNKSNEDEIRRKVGQLFLLAFTGDQPEPVIPFIKDRGIGGLYLSNDNLRKPEDAARLLNILQENAINGISGVPLLTAADQEGAWGVMVPYSSTGPGNMALGASDAENTRKMYSVFSEELAAVGVFCDLTPAADVNSNPDNPIIGTRSFGENPEEVAIRVVKAIEGLHQNNVVATAKHFPGHGNTATDSHSGIPKVSRSIKDIESIDLLPFRRAVEAGVDIVMTAHIVYEALDADNPATLSSEILNNYLRNKLGFEGVIITDSFNMNSIQKNYDPSEAAIQAILAGADMIMLAEERYGEDVGDYIKSQTTLLDNVEQAVLQGRIPMQRLDEAYNRIVRLKEKYQLSQRIPVDPNEAKKIVGSEKNRAIGLACAEAALNVTYDKSDVLPLSKEEEIAVVKLTKEDIGDIVTVSQGIGPNYSSAFEDFLFNLEEAGFKIKLYEHTDKFDERFVIAVSENYPFAGILLDHEEQRSRLSTIKSLNPDCKLINVALRDPYDANLVEADTYISAIGSNISNVKAVVNLLDGKIEAKGILPVTPISAD